MDTQQQLQAIAIERDALKKSVEDLNSQLNQATLEKWNAKGGREAPFSLTFHMIDKYGCQFQATIREGITKEIIKQVFEARQGFIELALDNGYRIPGKAADVAPSTPSPSAPPSPSVPPPPAAPVNGNGAQESLCQMIEVGTSFTGGKTQLKFHCKGMDHPLSFTKPMGEMAKLLAPLGYTQAHIVVGEKYPASAMVKWEQGEKYRNVLAVRPA